MNAERATEAAFTATLKEMGWEEHSEHPRPIVRAQIAAGPAADQTMSRQQRHLITEELDKMVEAGWWPDWVSGSHTSMGSVVGLNPAHPAGPSIHCYQTYVWGRVPLYCLGGDVRPGEEQLTAWVLGRVPTVDEAGSIVVEHGVPGNSSMVRPEEAFVELD